MTMHCPFGQELANATNRVAAHRGQFNKKVGHIINVFSFVMCPIFFVKNDSEPRSLFLYYCSFL